MLIFLNKVMLNQNVLYMVPSNNIFIGAHPDDGAN